MAPASKRRRFYIVFTEFVNMVVQVRMRMLPVGSQLLDDDDVIAATLRAIERMDCGIKIRRTRRKTIFESRKLRPVFLQDSAEKSDNIMLKYISVSVVF